MRISSTQTSAVRHIGWLAALVLIIFMISGCSRSSPTPTPAIPTATPAPTPTFTPAQPSPSANTIALIDALGRDFAERRVIDVYQTVAPAVVNITTRTYQRGFFFEPIPAEGAGSGFVLDDQGHILTNYHVIQDAERVEVNFDDNTTVPAEIVGTDSHNDVALLKVDASPDLLHPVNLGTSGNLEVGQRAIAIGNPFGQFGRTLTTGVISALDRTLQSPDKRTITGVIQTDAAINRGNSGGPLLDSEGNVIGITTAIFSPTGASAGIGFAIPIDRVKRILPDLLELGHYRHPWLGIRYAYTVTPGLAEMLKLPVDQGVLLVQLAPNSPLADAGARGAQQKSLIGNQIVYVGGDILTAVDGQPVGSWEELQTLLEDNYQVGDKVTVTLRQDQTTLEVEVTLEEEGT